MTASSSGAVRARRLAQGHLNALGGSRNRTIYLPVTSQPALPPKTHAAPEGVSCSKLPSVGSSLNTTVSFNRGCKRAKKIYAENIWLISKAKPAVFIITVCLSSSTTLVRNCLALHTLTHLSLKYIFITPCCQIHTIFLYTKISRVFSSYGSIWSWSQQPIAIHIIIQGYYIMFLITQNTVDKEC